MNDDVKIRLFLLVGFVALVGGVVLCNKQDTDFLSKCVSAGRAPLECTAAKNRK